MNENTRKKSIRPVNDSPLKPALLPTIFLLPEFWIDTIPNLTLNNPEIAYERDRVDSQVPEPVPPDVHRCQRGGRIGKAPGRAGIGGDAGERVHQGAAGLRDHRRGASRGFGHSLSADTEAAQAREAEQETGQVGQGLGGLHVRLLILQVADSLSFGHSHAFHGVFFLPVTMPRRRPARVNNGAARASNVSTNIAHFAVDEVVSSVPT